MGKVYTYTVKVSSGKQVPWAQMWQASTEARSTRTRRMRHQRSRFAGKDVTEEDGDQVYTYTVKVSSGK